MPKPVRGHFAWLHDDTDSTGHTTIALVALRVSCVDRMDQTPSVTDDSVVFRGRALLRLSHCECADNDRSNFSLPV